jgi:hypothetical protein
MLVSLIPAEVVFQVFDLIVSKPMTVTHAQTLPEMLVDTH